MEPLIKISQGATKWDIRQKVWDYIEDKNLANFPRPVHNRIPNFKGAIEACNRLAVLQEFKSSQTVKINPDKPQQQARLVTLEAHKTLLVPTPRLRSGLFNKIVPPQGANKEQLRICSSSQGVKEFSVPIGLDAKVKVDLVVVGSVAVSEKGFRIGKGEGYADLEYGMMASMGAVDESTVVVTVVHDSQVVDISEEIIESHDLTVDYILTPSRVIKTNCLSPKPQGIIWTKLDTAKLEKMPILKKLLTLEEQAGKDVMLGTEPPATEPPLRNDHPKRQNRRRPRQKARQDTQEDSNEEKSVEPVQNTRRNPPRVRKESRGSEGEDVERRRRKGRGGGNMKEKSSEETGGEGLTQSKSIPGVTTVYLGGIPTGVRVSALKIALREREAGPLRLTWQGAQHRAFLDYSDQQAAEKALEALQGLSLNGQSVQAALAKSQRRSKKPGPSNRRPKPAAATAATCDAEATSSKSEAPEKTEQ
ncbi:methenyltetrahydrofolate synthase domain-containing protein isoform X2 [Dunckerocampus dactyliophorus]|uniref:methenyltetrahydrofolate synthase domain-containing protein isoform X2 n=1 Tax=Dunckerocampus dactyliophorus TaxID=161453 RepID=UPI0024055F37|nr:methenyltetrahydrofolate synthase domain-containing protein isoform X2 [Dunckerocampus dactyliophorus]